MAEAKMAPIMRELNDVLDQERTALLLGKLESLKELLPSKENLVGQLNADLPDNPGKLTRLERKLRRNQLLLDSALEGIRNVAQKMTKVHKMRGALATYDAAGRKSTIEVDPEHAVEKRA
ncbi:MAG: flagellar biosynthesis protein FlgN [Pseudomonadota bacterium]